MKVSRFVSFGAAVVISAFQWSPFFSMALHAQSMRVVGAPIAGSSMPIVITTHHQS